MINKIILFSTTLAGLAKHDSWQGKSVTGEMRSRTQVLTLSAPGTERALERTLSAPGMERALERTLSAPGTERALERTPS